MGSHRGAPNSRALGHFSTVNSQEHSLWCQPDMSLNSTINAGMTWVGCLMPTKYLQQCLAPVSLAHARAGATGKWTGEWWHIRAMINVIQVCGGKDGF